MTAQGKATAAAQQTEIVWNAAPARHVSRRVVPVVALALVMILSSLVGIVTLSAVANGSAQKTSDVPTAHAHTALCSCACYNTCGGTCPEGTVSFSSVQIGTSPTGATFSIVDDVDASITLQWGTTTSYGSSWGPTSEPTSFMITIGSLSAHTAYDYKLSGSASCYNSGSHTGSFATTYVIYDVEIAVFEGFGTVQISNGGDAPGTGTYSSGEIAGLGVGAEYALTCEVDAQSTQTQYTASPVDFSLWYGQGGLTIDNTGCDSMMTVTGGSGSGVLVMGLSYTNDQAYVPNFSFADPQSPGGLSYWGTDLPTLSLAPVPFGGYVYGDTPPAPNDGTPTMAGVGTVYGATGTFVVPDVEYSTYGGTWTGPEVADMWVGLGGYNYWDNDEYFWDNGYPTELLQAGVAMFYQGEGSSLTIFPWVQGMGGIAYCYGAGNSLPEPADGTGNVLNCATQGVPTSSFSINEGDTVTVTVAEQPCNPSGSSASPYYAAGFVMIKDDSSSESPLWVDYWYSEGDGEGDYLTFMDCLGAGNAPCDFAGASSGPICLPDYNTAAWGLEVPYYAVEPDITSASVPFSDLALTNEFPTSFSDFESSWGSGLPNTLFDDGTSQVASFTSQIIVSGMGAADYTILPTVIDTSNGDFSIVVA